MAVAGIRLISAAVYSWRSGCFPAICCRTVCAVNARTWLN